MTIEATARGGALQQLQQQTGNRRRYMLYKNNGKQNGNCDMIMGVV